MAKAKEGDKVKVHYTGKLADGTVFDSSVERGEPLEFTIGEGRIIPGFEQAVLGMEKAESKTIVIESGDAYGPHREDMVAEVERSQLPPDIDPQVGQQLQVQQDNGQSIVVTVTEVGEEKITLDGNHPLAGKDLAFDIELVSIS